MQLPLLSLRGNKTATTQTVLGGCSVTHWTLLLQGTTPDMAKDMLGVPALRVRLHCVAVSISAKGVQAAAGVPFEGTSGCRLCPQLIYGWIIPQT